MAKPVLVEKPLRIGLITDAIDDKGAGIGIYVRNFLKTLAQLDKKNKYFLIHNKKVDDEVYKLGFEEIVVPIPSGPMGRERRKITTMPSALKKYKLDVVHELAQMGPFLMPAKYKKVVTVHDLIPLIHPETSPKHLVYHIKYAMPLLLQATNRIIVNSDNTKSDVIKNYKLSEDKITRVHYGSDPKFKVIDDEKKLKATKKKYKLPDNFFIMVSTIEPRKNMVRMVQAFAKYKEKDKKDMKLIIVGGKGWRDEHEKVEKAIKESKLDKDVILLGRVDNAQMPEVYALASALIFPSIYEGFGIPIMEAQAVGCPVVTSDISSMPEVAGGAAVLVDPYSIDDIARGMSEIVKTSNKDMIKRGIENVKRFSWENNVKETLKVYREVLNEK